LHDADMAPEFDFAQHLVPQRCAEHHILRFLQCRPTCW
jgi:hypothetical protein